MIDCLVPKPSVRFNCLLNKDTINALERQMTFEALSLDNVHQRVYSSFDGRIYATRNEETKSVTLAAYSWDKVREFPTIKSAAKWLIQEHIEYHKRLKFDK